MFSFGQQNFSAYTAGLLHPHRNFGYLRGSLTPIQRFQISPQVSYTHSEISNISLGLLHPYRNFGYLRGSLTPIQKFRISSRVSYTHTPVLSPEGIYSPLSFFAQYTLITIHLIIWTMGLLLDVVPKDQFTPHSPRMVNN